MKDRSLPVLIAVAIVALLPIEVAGQTRSATAESWTPPGTPWGDPDLQGIWDFRTITPMERPSEFAGKQVLTDEEAASFEAQENRRLNRDLVDPKKGGIAIHPSQRAALFRTTSFGMTEEQR